MTKDETWKLRLLEAEHQRLKKLVADLSLDNAMLKEVPLAKALTPLKKRMVTLLRDSFAVSERRACRVLGFSRTTPRRHSPNREKDHRLVERLRTLARERPRFGYQRIRLMLGREGATVNQKRVYRIYRPERLAVRKRERRKLWSAPPDQSRTGST